MCLIPGEYDYHFRWIIRKPKNDNTLWWKLLERGLLMLSRLSCFWILLFLEIVFIALTAFWFVIAFISIGYRNIGCSPVEGFLEFNMILVPLLFADLLKAVMDGLTGIFKKKSLLKGDQGLVLSNCSIESAITKGCVIGAFVLRNSPVNDRFLYIDFVGSWDRKI